MKEIRPRTHRQKYQSSEEKHYCKNSKGGIYNMQLQTPDKYISRNECRNGVNSIYLLISSIFHYERFWQDVKIHRKYHVTQE